MKNYYLFLLILLGTGKAHSQWVDMPVPASYHLYAVETITDDIVFAGGYGGSLVRTGNAGSTWESISIGSSNWINEIHFTSAANGWIATSSGSSNPAQILKSTDGGLTWTSVRDIEEYSSMSWPTPQIGYFGTWSGTIVKTTDTGQTWTILNLATTDNVPQVQFLDTQTGFAVSTDSYMHRTSDGGATWEKIYVPGVRRVFFHDANNGICINAYGEIGRTTDGGSTFTYWQTPFNNYKLLGMNFSSPMRGYVVGGLDCANGNCITKPVILTTNDGGVTWYNDLNHNLLGMERGFYDIDCTPNGTPFIAGSDALVLKNTAFAETPELSGESSLIVSPNPNSGKFSIDLPSNAEYLRIHSTTGELVYERSTEQQKNLEIDIQSMKAGVYFLSLEMNDGTSQTEKLIIH